MKRRKATRGYTVVEVLMAIGVLTAGSVAIMAMLQAATRGNMEAREMTTANQLAQRWVERLRRDGLNWTRGSTTPDVTLLTNTTYLGEVPAVGGTALWYVPEPPADSTDTANFDYYGDDLVDGATPYYCTNVRLEWLYPGQAMRADVRVWWMRRGGGVDSDQLVNCAAGTNPNTLTGDRRVRMVYTSTVIRFTPRPS